MLTPSDTNQTHIDPRLWAFHVTPWEDAFLTRIRSARSVIRIACPFIKLRNIRLILSCIHREVQPIRLQVLTRLNARDCRAFVHDIAAMYLLLDNPLGKACDVQLRMDNSLHAKLYIFDDRETIVTSSNLTYAAFYRNREVALATSGSGIVKATVEHFSQLFSRSEPITLAMLDEVRGKLSGTAAELPEISFENATEPVTSEEEDALDSLALDSQVIEAIDDSVRGRLGQELAQGALSLETETPEQAEADQISENRFYEDVLRRFRCIFGAPSPTISDVAAIWVHRSAYPQLRHATPNRDRAAALEEVGKRVLYALLAQLVAEDLSSTMTGEAISTKSSYIASSNHLVSQLNSLGLCRAVVGRGVGSSKPESSSRQREAERIAATLAVRLVGYLFRHRPWSHLVEHFRRILRLREEFPFESYRHERFKCWNATEKLIRVL